MSALAKSVALLLALLGYAMLWQRRKMPVCFFPITAVSGAAVAVYVTGMCGSLQIGWYLVILLGMVLLLRFFSLEGLKRVCFDRSILFCIAAGVIMFAATRGQMLYHWDDGSHWYRMCKALYFDGHYPTTPDILFYDYVPGTATWVYIVLQAVGFSIPNCLFAQNCICIAAISALFCLTDRVEDKRKKVIASLIVVGTGLVQCTYACGVYTLLVDLPLGLVTAAAMIMVLDWGNRKGSTLPVMLVLAFLAIVKNSALFFLAAVCLMAAVTHRFSLRRACAWLGLPLLAWGAYALRGAVVYGGKATPQAISADRYAALWNQKSADLIGRIARGILRIIFGGKTGVSVATYFCLAVLLIVAVSFIIEEERDAAARMFHSLAACAVLLLAYAGALFMTFSFSMSSREAEVLNGIDRYYGSAVILLIGVTMYLGVGEAVRLRRAGTYLLSMFLMIAYMMPGLMPRAYVVNRLAYTRDESLKTDLWWAIERIVPENRSYSEESYLVLWNQADFMDGENNQGRLDFAIGAWLRADHISVVSKDELAALSEDELARFREFDHVIFLSDMNDEKDLLEPYLDIDDYGIGFRSL